MELYKAHRITLKSKPKFLPASEAIPVSKNQADQYDSLFFYKKEHIERFNETGTLAGIKDPITNRVYFDLDSKTDLELARKEALTLVDRLENLGINNQNYRITFSGSKGFGVEFQIDKYISPDQFKSLVYNVADGLSTFDPSVSDAQRIVRCINSKHQITGLYKIPLTKAELKDKTIEDIKALATEPRNYNEKQKVVVTPKMEEMLTPKTKAAEKKEVTANTVLYTDLSEKPEHLDTVRFYIQRGLFETGERHNALLALAAYLKNKRFTKKETYYALKSAADAQAERTETPKFSKEEIWGSIIESVYGDNWKGGHFSLKDPNSWLSKYAVKNNIPIDSSSKPITMGELGGEFFTKYAKSFFESRIYTGLPDLDRDFPLCAGTNVAIVGAASSGKTSLALDILANSKDQGFISVFASLDMSKSRLYEKMIYKVTEGKFSREEIFNDYINGNGEKYDKLVKDAFPNVYIFAKSNPTLEEIRDYILSIQQSTGKDVRLLLIDYFERIGSSKADDTSASKDIASRIQDLLADFPMLTPITLYQPNKMALGGGPDKPILNYTAIKGSSFIFQSVRQIISLWRPFFNPRDKDMDDYMELAILKNDLGELGMYCYNWKGKTGKITPMTVSDKVRYDAFIEEKKNRDKAEKDEEEGKSSKWDL